MRWRRGGADADVIDVRGGAPAGAVALRSRSAAAANVQDTWTRTFQAQGRQYERAKLVLYSGGVNTACGSASSAVGPFYCPGDRRVYLDLSFYRDMQSQLRAGGDFAWAYVIAHEVGHHIQQVLGTSAQVDQVRRTDPDTFTHGSSAQRRAWFDRGRARGEPADCDTFSADEV